MTYIQSPSQSSPPRIPINDPRANTTTLPNAADVIFLLHLGSAFRYRLPTGRLLPSLLNAPSAGTIWADLGMILLGLTTSNNDIDTAAKWFPMSWTSPQGTVQDASAFAEDTMLGQAMFPCTAAYGQGGDGFNCWFRLSSDAVLSDVSITPTSVMALLNSAAIRAEIAQNIGGGVSLDIVNLNQFPRKTQNFQEIVDSGQSDYSQKKSYFAAGLVVWFVLTAAALLFLWVWTGSGRTS
jgi:hypothetical protein